MVYSSSVIREASGIEMHKIHIFLNKTHIFLIGLLMAAGTNCRADINLVPAQPAASPNYFCTWSAQNYLYGDGSTSFDEKELEGSIGGDHAKDMMNENALFGSSGFAKTFFPSVRKDLYFLLDDGYYEYGANSFRLDPQKFPSFTGDPSHRLLLLSQAVKAQGWRGLGMWTRGTPSDTPAITTLLQWSQQAGVAYWKIDGGDRDFSVAALKATLYPGLTLEHIYGEGPLNGDWSQNGRFGTQDWNSDRVNIVKRSEVYRTYDVTAILAIPTTLDRVAQILNGSQGHPEVTCLINCEDETYLAASLGCTMGIMRYPLYGLRQSGDPDVFFNGPRQTKKRMDEVVRALHWERIAEPYGAGVGTVTLDPAFLEDDWRFQPGQTWDSDIIGKDVKQSAPARVSRNLPLPNVACDGEPPFVTCARFPNGAVSICTSGRTHSKNGWTEPEADITLNVGDAKGPFGIFGVYHSLTITTAAPIRKSRIYAQDLAGTKAVDITKKVVIKENTLTVPGNLISTIGTLNKTPGDLSDPGLVIAVMPK